MSSAEGPLRRAPRNRDALEVLPVERPTTSPVPQTTSPSHRRRAFATPEQTGPCTAFESNLHYVRQHLVNALERRGPPPDDYEVAVKSRMDVSLASLFALAFCSKGAQQRAVSIDYPRSWRTGGNPSTGCNRAHRVGARGSWTPGAAGTHSPSLDSRCSAFSARSLRPEESEIGCGASLFGAPQRVVGLVGRAVAPEREQHTG
jgi:hypothetical protein